MFFNNTLRNIPTYAISLYGLAVLIAVYTFEYGFGYLPCQLCLYQRVPWAILIILGALSIIMPNKQKHILYIAVLVMFGSIVLALFHSGVEYGFWQGLAGCQSTTEIALDTSSLLNSLATETMPSCDVPAWTLFGISLSGYNAIISLDALIFCWLLAKNK